ncbi:DNA-3-methyladenine glycosylase 1 [Corynebacterium canis]|nr:DNA-3-methyladenine glycosylase 1 [Corynebacterium canis]
MNDAVPMLIDAQLPALGLTRGVDGRIRPTWAESNDQMREYYDYEWGREVRDEQGLLERVCLEGFQAGLSWNLVLQKRAALREAFYFFDPDAVAAMSEAEIVELAQRPELIRNNRKLMAAVGNAAATVALREDVGLSELLWSFQPEDWQVPEDMAHMPNQTPESVAMAKELKRRGFSYVGPVTCFALMQAVGMVDCRIPGSSPLLDPPEVG